MPCGTSVLQLPRTLRREGERRHEADVDKEWKDSRRAGADLLLYTSFTLLHGIVKSPFGIFGGNEMIHLNYPKAHKTHFVSLRFILF